MRWSGTAAVPVNCFADPCVLTGSFAWSLRVRSRLQCQHMYNPPGQELWYLFGIRFSRVQALTVPTLVRAGKSGGTGAR